MNPIDQLKSVLCDPTGKCCIAGSEEDRAIVDRALQALAQPADFTQVSKVWWDGEKLMAKPIPLEDIYKPAQDDNDFPLGKACDLSGEGTCEACQ